MKAFSVFVCLYCCVCPLTLPRQRMSVGTFEGDGGDFRYYRIC